MIPDNACIPRITAAAGTELADAYSSSTVRTSFLRKEVYRPKSFIPHAVLLRQAFAHCGKFLTAASRRSLGRVSVPVWLIILSNQLLIVALVSHYLTNKLIRCELILEQKTISPLGIWRFSIRFQMLFSSQGQILTCYAPVRH